MRLLTHKNRDQLTRSELFIVFLIIFWTSRLEVYRDSDQACDDRETRPTQEHAQEASNVSKKITLGEMNNNKICAFYNENADTQSYV